MIYIYMRNKDQSSISFVVFLSVSLSVFSLIVSFIAFIIATTSILSNKDMHKLKESGIITNYSADISSSLDYLKKKEEQEKENIEHKLKEIQQMPLNTELQKDNFEHLRSEIKIDFHHAYNIALKRMEIESSVKDKDNFENELDAELLDNPGTTFNQAAYNSAQKEISYENLKLALKENEKQISQSVEDKQNKRKLVWYKPGFIREFKLRATPVPPIKNFNLAVPSQFKNCSDSAIKEVDDNPSSKSVSDVSNFSFEINSFVGKIKNQASVESPNKTNQSINSQIQLHKETIDPKLQTEIVKTDENMV